MNKHLFLIILSVLLLLTGCKNAVSDNQPKNEPDPAVNNSHIVVAYIVSWSSVMPDCSLMTHLNYAFGHVNNSFNGIRIDEPQRLRAISAAKGDVKLCLSVGGWGSGGFSEMAMSEENRLAFAADCSRVIDEYALDGIDIDWEYPTSSAAEISSSPEDTRNFTLLMKDIRAAIGPDKLLTLASVNSAEYIDVASVVPVVDWVNVMAYDMGNPPRHHAALFNSTHSSYSADKAVHAHLRAGVPKDKLVLGMPFYGHGDGKSYDAFLDYRDLTPPLPGHSEEWDDVAKVPFYADADGHLVLSFDNPRSIAEKCRYIIDQNLLGGMYWEYTTDNSAHELARTVAGLLLEE